MARNQRSGPDVEWADLVDSIHARNWRRAHRSPSLLLARRERTWRLHDRMPDGFTGSPWQTHPSDD